MLLFRRSFVKAVLFILLGVSLGGCEYRAASEAGTTRQQNEGRVGAPDQITEDARFFIYEDNRPRALVEARRMERYEREDSTYTLLRGHLGDSPGRAGPGSGASDSTKGRVSARIYDEKSDSIAATIRANRLIYRDEERRFDARGRVVVTTTGGKRLESEHLAWLEEERRIQTPGFVRITTPTDRIQGYGLRADENLDTYHLRRVTGQVAVEEAL